MWLILYHLLFQPNFTWQILPPYSIRTFLTFSKTITSLIARFMGPTWGPSGADRTQVGPTLAPWTLLPGLARVCLKIKIIISKSIKIFPHIVDPRPPYFSLFEGICHVYIHICVCACNDMYLCELVCVCACMYLYRFLTLARYKRRAARLAWCNKIYPAWLPHQKRNCKHIQYMPRV